VIADRSKSPRNPTLTDFGFPFLAAAGVAILFYVCFFGHLGALGFVGPDEPRYASIARAMSETGDWITARLNGQPWFEKPVLYYWAAGISFRLFGVSEFAARLPSALAAAFATLVIAWTARRYYGRGAALLTLLLAPTTVGMFGFARAATPDMLFSACLTAAMAAAAGLLWGGGLSPRALLGLRIGFGVFLGAAALAKGPAALVLAGGSVALWTLVSRRWRDALSLLDPLAILSFCVVALPWYVLCAMRNPDFLRIFFLAHNFERYLTPVFHHQQPVWYFIGILALGLLPWTVLLLPTARDAIRSWREGRAAGSPALFFACLAVFPFLFFSFSKSKLPGYILPGIPPLLLLLARSTARLLEEKSALARWSAAATGATFVALAFFALFWLRRFPIESTFGVQRSARVLLLAIGTAGLLAVALGAAGKLRTALLTSIFLMACLVEVIGIVALPAMDRDLSPRFEAERGAHLVRAAANLAAFRLNRAWKYGLDFYLHRDLPEWTPQTPRPCLLFTNEAGYRELKRLGVTLIPVTFGTPEGWAVLISDSEDHTQAPAVH
jgi:4-amino-4-deoxy-L-arabinose transferase-like glycosyltransferase